MTSAMELSSQRVRKLTASIAVCVIVAMIGLAGFPWLAVGIYQLAPHTRRAIIIGFYNSVLIAYGITLITAPVVGAIMFRRVISGRRGPRRTLSAKILLLCISSLIGLGMLECSTLAVRAWSRLPPRIPNVPARKDNSKSRDIVLLVLGESSALGEPFQPWLSIGQILAWQIELALPGRNVRIITDAEGGAGLDHSVARLADQTECPDIVLVFAGHNEFQSRWGWSQAASYYKEDTIGRIRNRLVDRVGNFTPFFGLIRDCVDRQSIDRRPSRWEIDDVLDRPVCSPTTRANVRNLFERELETIVRWSERARAVPILVMPAGNDADYDPGRSIMSPDTSREERAAFARTVHETLALESTDPAAAMVKYRELIARQPDYSEAHYRLAKVLQALGRTVEARAEYARARDLDGMPMRCPSEFQDAYFSVSSRHNVVLVDAPQRLTALSPTRLLDNNVFHDGQHPNFRAYVDLAQSAIDKVWARGDLGLPKGSGPRVDPSECAAHFGLDFVCWAEICRRASQFWRRLAETRHDPTYRKQMSQMYEDAAKAIEAGRQPDRLGVPGPGCSPQGFFLNKSTGMRVASKRPFRDRRFNPV